MEKKRFGIFAALVLCLSLTLAACGGGGGGGGSATLVSIAVTPATSNIATGTTQQFTATGTYSDSTTQDLTASAAWSSSDTAVATVSSAGLAASVAVGSTTITATSGSIDGTAVLTVTNATLASIAVTPANPSIVKGTTQQFTATGTFSDSTTQNLTTQVTWSSSDTGKATINSAGFATSIAIGTTTITAASGSISGSTTLTIATLVSIAVTPANASIVRSATRQFTATGTFSNSATQNLTTQVTWSSTTTSVATISTVGMVTPLSAGTTTITAVSGSISGNTTLTVQGVNLPKTGQITSYGTGTIDDGGLQRGVDWPDPRFTAGTASEVDCVTDNLTGLMLVKAPDSTLRTWQAALDYADGLTLCGHTDWRLPNMNELESLVHAEYTKETTCGGACATNAAWLNTQGFNNVPAGSYWSSTTYAGFTAYAWFVNMNDGNVNNDNKTNNNYVWPVRSGEWLPRNGATPHLYPLPVRGEEVKAPSPLRGEGWGEGRRESDADLFSFENLYRQYLKCRRNKRGTINALKFEVNAEENLFKLSEELKAKTYQPTRSVCFIVEKPKMREIIAADFRDRVVHHVLIDRLEAQYEPVFIHDSYACRKEKGLHRAVERVREFIRRGGENGRRKLFFAHLDIKNFFMTIDKHVLYEILRKKVKDEDVPWLAHLLIFHNPTENCVIKGKRQLMDSLPPHKSLFQAGQNRGLPVGNLTSQFFANLYLNELDQYVKHILKCRFYVRYCDDFLLLDGSPARLEEIKTKIAGFAAERLRLTLNEKHGKVLPVSNGMDFLGYIIRRDYTLVRRRVANNLKARLDDFEKMLMEEKNGTTIFHYDYALLEKLRAVLASYMGHLKWADTRRLRTAILKRYDFLNEYFSFKDGKIKPVYGHPRLFPSIKSQYFHYARRFRGATVLFQVGSFHEFYAELKKEVQNAIELRRFATRKRPAFYGFSVRFEKEYAGRLSSMGIPVVIIKETDRYIGRIKERLPLMKITKTKEEKTC